MNSFGVPNVFIQRKDTTKCITITVLFVKNERKGALCYKYALDILGDSCVKTNQRDTRKSG